MDMAATAAFLAFNGAVADWPPRLGATPAHAALLGATHGRGWLGRVGFVVAEP